MNDTTTAELDRLFGLQKAAFAKDRSPSLETRLERLKTLDAAMIAFRDEFRAAMSADFCNRSGSSPRRVN
jgi:coniferyl-aldehyde dehydrogenase